MEGCLDSEKKKNGTNSISEKKRIEGRDVTTEKKTWEGKVTDGLDR
jgi:hypothetical protein